MEWRDQGLVIGARRFGESAVVLEAMTRAHGRHLGLVHGGASRKKAPFLQAGNTLDLHWRARLDENLGTYAVEPQTQRAGHLLDSEVSLLVVGTVSEHLRLLAERDPHPALYDAATIVLDGFPDVQVAAALLVRFETAFLDALGVGLDLTRCARSGLGSSAKDNVVLAYVSPKSGRAVSAAEGAPYASRLLALPPFLVDPSSPLRPGDLADGYRLTGHFLERHLYGAHGLREPYARRRLVALLGGRANVNDAGAVPPLPSATIAATRR